MARAAGGSREESLEGSMRGSLMLFSGSGERGKVRLRFAIGVR